MSSKSATALRGFWAASFRQSATMSAHTMASFAASLLHTLLIGWRACNFRREDQLRLDPPQSADDVKIPFKAANRIQPADFNHRDIERITRHESRVLIEELAGAVHHFTRYGERLGRNDPGRVVHGFVLPPIGPERGSGAAFPVAPRRRHAA